MALGPSVIQVDKPHPFPFRAREKGFRQFNESRAWATQLKGNGVASHRTGGTPFRQRKQGGFERGSAKPSCFHSWGFVRGWSAFLARHAWRPQSSVFVILKAAAAVNSVPQSHRVWVGGVSPRPARDQGFRVREKGGLDRRSVKLAGAKPSLLISVLRRGSACGQSSPYNPRQVPRRAQGQAHRGIQRCALTRRYTGPQCRRELLCYI